VARFSVAYLSLAALLAALYLLARPLIQRLSPGGNEVQFAVLLGFLLALASLSGPVRPLIRRLGERLVPLEEEAPALGMLEGFPSPPAAGAEEVFASAGQALQSALQLSGCGALLFTPEGPHWTGWWGGERPHLPEPSAALQTCLVARRQVLGVEEADAGELTPGDRLALAELGASLLVPLCAGGEVRAALVLGRRLSGTWFSRRERRAVAVFADHASVALENVLLRGAARQRGALERELVAARSIQTHLLPRRAPVYPTLDCAGLNHASEEVGGDYYDFLERASREFVFAVGDCAGKGVPAALLLANVQASFRREAAGEVSPAELLGCLNRQLAHFDQPEKFVSLFCAHCDVRSARLTYANAGFPPVQLRRADGTWRELEESGLLLGVREDACYGERVLTLDPGDLLVCATDGVTEAQRGDELFGVERLRRVVDAHASLRAARVCEALLRGVFAFAAGQHTDDLTIVALRQLAAPANGRA
jgi:serine phosphatase RsbU (regulator of sigma subunit)